MNANAKTLVASFERPGPASAEQRLKELHIELPALPEPFGTYVEAVQTGNLLFLTGMLPTEGHGAKFTGRVGAELDVVVPTLVVGRRWTFNFRTCEFTNTVHSSATPELMEFLGKQGIPVGGLPSRS